LTTKLLGEQSATEVKVLDQVSRTKERFESLQKSYKSYMSKVMLEDKPNCMKLYLIKLPAFIKNLPSLKVFKAIMKINGTFMKWQIGKSHTKSLNRYSKYYNSNVYTLQHIHQFIESYYIFLNIKLSII
jgi:hypothetical protein